ncbi:MAG: tyrosine-protein phosphatase, partial [Actinomycetota bacterium]
RATDRRAHDRADAQRAHDELGIQTLVDLRGEMEISFSGTGLLHERGLVRHHFPLSSKVDTATSAMASGDRSPDAMVQHYIEILEGASDLVVSAVEEIAADDALPAVFFCAAGKDRTGVLSAVVLGAVDVKDEHIVTDYALTAETVDLVIERFASSPNAPALYRDNPPSYFAPVGETMKRVVDEVKSRYGSFARYLIAKGADETKLERLRHSLVG